MRGDGIDGNRDKAPCEAAIVIMGDEVMVTLAPAEAKKLVADSGVARVFCIVCCSAAA